MNTERMLALAAHLEALGPDAEVGFDMDTFYCGTAACIAGHAVLLFAPEMLEHRAHIGFRAMRLLELGDSSLFYAMNLETPQQAAWVIRKMVENGDVTEDEDDERLHALVRQARIALPARPLAYRALPDGTQDPAARLAGFDENGDPLPLPETGTETE